MSLEYEDYRSLGGFDEVTDEAFPALLARAKRMIDSQVGFDVSDQHERGFVSESAFKFYQSALVSQIEYIHFVGIRKIAGMKETQDVKVGNFSYSEGMSRGGAVIENPQFSNQVFDYLAAAGFLGGAVMTIGD